MGRLLEIILSILPVSSGVMAFEARWGIASGAGFATI